MNAPALLRITLTFATIAVASGCHPETESPSQQQGTDESPTTEAVPVEVVDVALGKPLDVAGWKGEGPVTLSDHTSRHARGPIHLRLRFPSGKTVCETVRTLFVDENSGKVIGVSFWSTRTDLPFAEALAEWHRLLTLLGLGENQQFRQRHAKLQAATPTFSEFGRWQVEPGLVAETKIAQLVGDRWDVSIELRMGNADD